MESTLRAIITAVDEGREGDIESLADGIKVTRRHVSVKEQLFENLRDKQVVAKVTEAEDHDEVYHIYSCCVFTKLKLLMCEYLDDPHAPAGLGDEARACGVAEWRRIICAEYSHRVALAEACIPCVPR